MIAPSPRRATDYPVATVTRLVPQVSAVRPVGRSVTEPVHEVQGTLALDLGQPRPAPPETPELDPHRGARVEDVADAEVKAWAARLAQAAVETIGGHRPVTQLVRWTTPQVYRDLEQRVRETGRVAAPRTHRIRPQVRSLHLCRPTTDAVEVSVHVRHGERSRAVAMRLERNGDRWVCSVLQFV